MWRLIRNERHKERPGEKEEIGKLAGTIDYSHYGKEYEAGS
jgi:hypothetical protein